jgi:hypothetical protein
LLASYQQGRTQHILVYQEEGVGGVDGSACDGDGQQPVQHQIEQVLGDQREELVIHTASLGGGLQLGCHDDFLQLLLGEQT